jgi:DNA-binding IclR family transcriptional regulator
LEELVDVSSVERTMTIVELLMSSEQNMGIREIAGLAGIPRSTVQRMLASLQEKNWVVQDPKTQSYRIGLRLLILANTWRLRFELVRQSREALEELGGESGQTVLLLVREGMSGICLNKVEPRRALKLVADVGKTFPLYAAACGKVLLAYAPSSLREKILASPIQSFTPSTITDPAVLRHEIGTIREKGYAHSRGEMTAGAEEIAVPLLDGEGNLLAALSLAGPCFEMDGRLEEHVHLLRKAVSKILVYCAPDGEEASE